MIFKRMTTGSFAASKWVASIFRVVALAVATAFTHSTVVAQTSAPSQAASAAEPSAAPGVLYTPDQMRARLLEIASGPPPSREDLAAEFGIKFEGPTMRHGYAPSPPFAEPLNSLGKPKPNIHYLTELPDDGSRIICFWFDMYGQGINSGARNNSRGYTYLLGTRNLLTVLRQPPWTWTRKVISSHLSADEFAEATFDGLRRSVTIWPGSDFAANFCIHYPSNQVK